MLHKSNYIWIASPLFTTSNSIQAKPETSRKVAVIEIYCKWKLYGNMTVIIRLFIFHRYAVYIILKFNLDESDFAVILISSVFLSFLFVE